VPIIILLSASPSNGSFQVALFLLIVLLMGLWGTSSGKGLSPLEPVGVTIMRSV
jgi:hypothetical protein